MALHSLHPDEMSVVHRYSINTDNGACMLTMVLIFFLSDPSLLSQKSYDAELRPSNRGLTLGR